MALSSLSLRKRKGRKRATGRLVLEPAPRRPDEAGDRQEEECGDQPRDRVLEEAADRRQGEDQHDRPHDRADRTPHLLLPLRLVGGLVHRMRRLEGERRETGGRVQPITVGLRYWISSFSLDPR